MRWASIHWHDQAATSGVDKTIPSRMQICVCAELMQFPGEAGAEVSKGKNLVNPRPFRLVAVFWWWLVEFPRCVGGGDAMSCDVIWYQRLVAR